MATGDGALAWRVLRQVDDYVDAWADPSADGGSVGAGLEWRW